MAEIAEIYPPRETISVEDLAEMFSCIVDGGIIMSKALGDPRRLERQIMAFRGLVKCFFSRSWPLRWQRPLDLARSCRLGVSASLA